MSFENLNLIEPLIKALKSSGYTQATPIQEQSIPQILKNRDLLGCAQTGTGKTAAFALPIIQMLFQQRATQKAKVARALVLAPTRELAIQVAESFATYGRYTGIRHTAIYGGVSQHQQTQALRRGVDVLIATPGRLLDHFERGKLLLNGVEILVIDEADRMLDMGFIPDIEKIFGLTPFTRQTLFFSATMPPEIRRLADKFLLNPKAISVDPPASAAQTVTQGLVKLRGAAKEKRAALRSLINSEEVKSALVFCNRKRDVVTLHGSHEAAGLTRDVRESLAAAVHLWVYTADKNLAFFERDLASSIARSSVSQTVFKTSMRAWRRCRLNCLTCRSTSASTPR